MTLAIREYITVFVNSLNCIRELAQAFPPVTIYSFCAAFLAVFIYWEFWPVVLVYELTMLSCNM